MAAPSPNSTPSVLGDFVLGWGADAAAWVRGLEGFTPVTVSGAPAQAAVRGAVHTGEREDGTRWLAVADLIAGRLDDGPRALQPGPPPQLDWRGRFATVAWHPAERRVAALTDHFSTLSLYTLEQGGMLLVATDLRLLASSPFCRRTVDLTSVYHYLNFANIPAPRTIFTDIHRLEPATRLRWEAGRPSREDRYYLPEYPEDLGGTDTALARELQERIVATVQAYRPDPAQPWGCFLSGGTDSSSIVTILSRKRGAERVKTVSIGFAETDYDELGFARLAANAAEADGCFHIVSREEAQSLVSRVIDAYDQPFGGASAVPTIACADRARAGGLDLLVAGDGGDEIFGGNERYAKDKVMSAWYALPGPVKAAARAVGGAVGGGSSHFLNRVENFFDRASLPNPDRFYTDDSFASDHYETLLKPEFRRAVARDASLEFMRSVFRQGSTGSPMHRVMRLDLLMAIAQNDLRKVHGGARSASVSVRFPYLDPLLVEFTNRLPERYKVRGLQKRYLFRRAMKDILPAEILRKKKQGFGLPIAVWLQRDRPFQTMVRDTLFDARARARGWWQPDFVEKIIAEHERGAWDHADYIWRLLVLELWLRRYVDAS